MRKILAGLAGVVVASVVFAQPTTAPDVEAVRDARRARAAGEVAAWDALNRQKLADSADHLLRPGLVADKRQRIVTLKATATGISGTEAIEFFLIAANSSKGYEAIAQAFSKPSDVAAAIEFLGVPRGRPVNHSLRRFWPKGERMAVTFHWEEASPDGRVEKRSARAEQLMRLRGTDKTLPETGLVYVGGVWLPPEKPGDPPRFYGDLGDPASIASNYNDATTLLDLPAQARQSEVYASRIVNPDFRFSPGQLLEITIEPAATTPRVLDLPLGVTGTELATARFDLAGRSLNLEGFLTELRTILADREPFMTVTPGDGMPLRAVRQVYALLDGLQTDAGLRLEPPQDGQIFHEAFLPDETFRDPRKRTWQPVELRLTGAGEAGGGGGVLRDLDRKSVAPEGEDTLTIKENPVPGPLELQKMLADRADQRRPLVIYAKESMTYGQLLRWLRPTLTAEPTKDLVLWIYLEP